jgi:hypothetical protein
METILTIKPTSKSNFLKAVRPRVFSEQMINGERRLVDGGEFSGNRVDGVKGIKRIKFNNDLHAYPIGELTREELNSLVAACRFVNDMPKHPDRGRVILTADPTDQLDPFFNNRRAEIRLEEYVGDLSSANPFHRIFAAYAKATPEEFLSSANPYSRAAKLKVVDLNKEVSDTKKVVDNSKKATELYMALNSDKKTKIALTLGLIKKQDTDIDLTDAALWKLCTATDDASLDKRNLFIALANLSTDKFNNRFLVTKARSKGKLKEVRNQGWLLNGIPIGLTLDDVHRYFDDINNQTIIAELEKSIIGKS